MRRFAFVVITLGSCAVAAACGAFAGSTGGSAAQEEAGVGAKSDASANAYDATSSDDAGGPDATFDGGIDASVDEGECTDFTGGDAGAFTVNGATLDGQGAHVDLKYDAESLVATFNRGSSLSVSTLDLTVSIPLGSTSWQTSDYEDFVLVGARSLGGQAYAIGLIFAGSGLDIDLYSPNGSVTSNGFVSAPTPALTAQHVVIRVDWTTGTFQVTFGTQMMSALFSDLADGGPVSGKIAVRIGGGNSANGSEPDNVVTIMRACMLLQ